MPPKDRSGLSSKAYNCTKCTKSFSKRSSLVDHGRATGHIILCAVSECSRVFLNENGLEQHLRDFRHQASSPPQPHATTPQIHAPPTQKTAGRLGENASSSSIRLSAHDNDMPRKSKTSRVSPDTFQDPASTTAESLTNDVYKRLLQMTTASATSSKRSRQEHLTSLDGGKQPSETTSEAKVQWQPPNDVSITTESERHTLLHGWYAPSDINDCFLIATPRNGGASQVLPIVHNCDGSDYKFAFFLPKLQQQAQLISLTPPGGCNACGVVFNSWASLVTHYKSSTCRIRSTSPPNEGLIISVSPPNYGTMSVERVKTSISTPGPQGGVDSHWSIFRSQLNDGRWSTISEAQQFSTLLWLSSGCHSYQTLTQNKYRSGSKVWVARKESSLIPLPTPAYDPGVRKRRAVALDCEMVGVKHNVSEVARISAVDCLSGELLIDTLVRPTQPVTDWRTNFSGITNKAMTAAMAEKRVLQGWPAARAELWKHIDSDTILIGQALNNDLQALRILHLRVIDSAILAKDAVGPDVGRQWGLKNLCKQLLDIDIQNHGREGHDSVEDAFAAREVVLWCIRHPEELAMWGNRQRAEHFRKREELRAKRAAQKLQQQALFSQSQDSDEYSEDQWENIA